MTETDVRLAFARRLGEEAKAAARRLTWPVERIAAYRDAQLRKLLRHAKALSPWHALRLRNIDVDQFTAQDLVRIPQMTKADLINNWGDIITDSEVTLDLAMKNLVRAQRLGRPTLLKDRYVTVTSSGATGPRAVVIWHVSDLLQAAAAVSRIGVGQFWQRSAREVQARLFSSHPAFVGAAMGWLTRRDDFETVTIGPTVPQRKMIHQLNDLMPTGVSGYGSVLHRLAAAQVRGDLRIAPTFLGTSAEPITLEMWDTIESAFAAPLVVEYSSTECMTIAASFPSGRVLHLFDDVNIVEPVDDAGNPTEPGTSSRSVYVTCLTNRTMPFIRYELGDEVKLVADPVQSPWSGRQIDRIAGRRDDWFKYGDVEVHPAVFRAAMDALPSLAYQIRQTSRGADILVLLRESCDVTPVAERVAQDLSALGLMSPLVRIMPVDDLPRLPDSGKLRYFIPLPRACT